MRLIPTLAFLVACTVLAAEDTSHFTIADTVDLSDQRHVVNDLDVSASSRPLYVGLGYRYMELESEDLSLHELEARGGYSFIETDRSLLRIGVGIRGRFDSGNDTISSRSSSTVNGSSTSTNTTTTTNTTTVVTPPPKGPKGPKGPKKSRPVRPPGTVTTTTTTTTTTNTVVNNTSDTTNVVHEEELDTDAAGFAFIEASHRFELGRRYFVDVFGYGELATDGAAVDVGIDLARRLGKTEILLGIVDHERWYFGDHPVLAAVADQEDDVDLTASLRVHNVTATLGYALNDESCYGKLALRF